MGTPPFTTLHRGSRATLGCGLAGSPGPELQLRRPVPLQPVEQHNAARLLADVAVPAASSQAVQCAVVLETEVSEDYAKFTITEKAPTIKTLC